MPRRQLFEFGDLPWIPTRLKHYLTDVLSIAAVVGERLGDAFCLEPVLDDIIAAMDQSKTDRIVDLCAGAAIPPVALQRRLAARGRTAEVILTDLHPNLAAFQRAAESTGCQYRVDSIDATSVPSELTGLRPVFNAFHHFPPDLARRILADAVSSRQGILIVEIPHRSPIGVLSTAAFFWICLLLTPLIRPISIERLLLTYLIPVLPVLVGFDGAMSSLRAYKLDELAALTEGLEDGYTWRIFRARGAGTPLAATVMLGRPTPQIEKAG